jgi:hypothetical protein
LVQEQILSNAAITRDYRRAHRFGRFDLQPEERRLLADGQPVALGARAFDLLVVLVERRELVGNELIGSMFSQSWRRTTCKCRFPHCKMLGQSASPRFRRGYRFGSDRWRQYGCPAEFVSSAGAAATEPVRARTNLPTRMLSLYGRAQDLATIKALLRQHVVLTIVGAGGIGKTRVAQAVAAEVAVESAADFPDGVWWVELAALSDGALVPSAAARALGMQLPNDRPAAAVASLLASRVCCSCSTIAST